MDPVHPPVHTLVGLHPVLSSACAVQAQEAAARAAHHAHSSAGPSHSPPGPSHSRAEPVEMDDELDEEDDADADVVEQIAADLTEEPAPGPHSLEPAVELPKLKPTEAQKLITNCVKCFRREKKFGGLRISINRDLERVKAALGVSRSQIKSALIACGEEPVPPGTIERMKRQSEEKAKNAAMRLERNKMLGALVADVFHRLYNDEVKNSVSLKKIRKDIITLHNTKISCPTIQRLLKDEGIKFIDGKWHVQSKKKKKAKKSMDVPPPIVVPPEQVAVVSDIWWFINTDVTSAVTTDWWHRILASYNAEGRHYHNILHIKQMLELAGQHQQLIHDYISLCLAIFFHDIVYDAKSSDNEEKSVAIFKDYATQAELPEKLTTKVSDYIMATKQHCTEVHRTPGQFGNTDLHLLLDLDLSVLGQPWPVYEKYASQIQQEYCHMSLNDYTYGRIRVMEGFLQIPNLYAVKEMRELFETQARCNIGQELHNLRAILTSHSHRY